MLSASVVGCVRYVAPLEHDVERGPLRFHLESVSSTRAGDTRVVLRVDETPRNVTLLAASLTGSDHSCGAGPRAHRAGRSGADDLRSPLTPGERVTLVFRQRAGTLTQEPLEVALRLRAPGGDVRCLRLPLSPDDKPLLLEADRPVTVGVEAGITGASPHLGPVSVAIVLPVTAGVWLGSNHLSGGIGPVWAGCGEPECSAPSEEQLIRYGRVGFVALGGIGQPIVRVGAFGIDAVARYRLMTLSANTKAGHELVVAHGPTVEPVIALVMPPADGIANSGGSREALFGLGVPLGVLFAEGGRPSFFWGLDVRLSFAAL